LTGRNEKGNKSLVIRSLGKKGEKKGKESMVIGEKGKK
jgi:hypothetical protein